MELEFSVHDEAVRSLPLRDPIAISPNTVVRAAVARMRSLRLGCAVIVDMEKRPLGVFTERSLLRLLIQNVSLDRSVVGDFADPEFVQIKSSAPISQVWESIRHEGARFICVTDEAGKLIGLTGQKGLAEYVTDYFPREVIFQRLGCKPWMQAREGA
jgi:CBS domain-containing protein